MLGKYAILIASLLTKNYSSNLSIWVHSVLNEDFYHLFLDRIWVASVKFLIVLIGEVEDMKGSGSYKPPSCVSSRKRSRVEWQREVYIIVLLTQSEAVFQIAEKIIADKINALSHMLWKSKPSESKKSLPCVLQSYRVLKTSVHFFGTFVKSSDLSVNQGVPFIFAAFLWEKNGRWGRGWIFPFLKRGKFSHTIFILIETINCSAPVLNLQWGCGLP